MSKESHSAPERSESGTGRYDLTCGITGNPEPLRTGDNSGTDRGMERRWQNESAPEMGNRRSSVHDSGSVRRGNEVECYQCGPREMALGRCKCLRDALRR